MNDLSVFYFPTAVALGALHALEPGHAKVLTASYLIGIKGTKRDSLILGLSVAATHSLVVILISTIGLWLGNEAFTGQATEWLARASGFVAIAIGSWMLWRRLFKRKSASHHHHHENQSVLIRGNLLSGLLNIVPTPLGEVVQFSTDKSVSQDTLLVRIERKNGRTETISLQRCKENPSIFLSSIAPEEPHEFSATLNCDGESCSFSVKEPDGHHHDHLDDIAHAKAHAEDLPDYAKSGNRPTTWQIITFGMAGGMIPCPASITVLLLALSVGKAGLGLFTVFGFSLGLAVALVGVGMAVVSGLSHLEGNGRFDWLTKKAPVISASLVICSGIFALLLAH